jgi:hypothetical protein
MHMCPSRRRFQPDDPVRQLRGRRSRPRYAHRQIAMEGELPAHESIAKLYAELDFQQATQSYLWALPLVSYAQWQEEFRDKLGAHSGDLMVLNSYEDKLGVITANATTPYILGFVDLNETGPLVIELPPGPTAGGIGDFWQRAIIDMGQTGPTRVRAASTWCCHRAPSHQPMRANITWPNRKR